MKIDFLAVDFYSIVIHKKKLIKAGKDPFGYGGIRFSVRNTRALDVVAMDYDESGLSLGFLLFERHFDGVKHDNLCYLSRNLLW